MAPEKRKIVLAGSGITSLATAYYLERFGITDYVMLEQQLEPGGLCRSVEKEGFTFDYTGHVLWRMDPETKTFYEDVLGNNLIWAPRKAGVWTHGRMVPYPFQAHLKSLPPHVAYECFKGFLEKGKYLKGTSFESWSLAQFGEGIHKHFMVPFNEKLWGVPMSEMTNDWTADVPAPSLDQVMRGTILGETFEMKGNSKFAYPKVGGMQALVNCLVQRFGDKIMTGRKVSKLDPKKKVLTHVDMAGNKNEIQYDYLVSTIPFRKFLKVLHPVNEKTREYAFSLRSNNVACVMLGFEKPLTDHHWIYVPESKYSFYRLGFPNNLTESVAPPGCGSVTAEITIPKNITFSTDDLIKSVKGGLKDMGLWEESNKILAVHVEYIAPAYVILDLIRQKVPRMIDGFKTMDIHCAGRYGAWHYTSVSDNVTEGRLAAKAIRAKVEGSQGQGVLA